MERLGTFLGLLLIPGIGFVIAGVMTVISWSDQLVRDGMPALIQVLFWVCGLATLLIGLSIFSSGRSRARQATLLDELAELTGSTRPALTAFDLPRVWCRVDDHQFEVVQNLVGRNAHVIVVDEEDGFRELYLSLASSPGAQVPRGRHWRISLAGDATAAYQLFVASNGPLARIGARLASLTQVTSGDAHFDDWALVYSDQPASATRLLSDPSRRATLLRLLNRNGTFISNLRVSPSHTPSEPGVIQSFVLHPGQNAEDVVLGIRDLIDVARWTHETT
jgi:hypothetical protein